MPDGTIKHSNSTIISKPVLNDNDAKVFFTNFIASSTKIQNIGLKEVGGIGRHCLSRFLTFVRNDVATPRIKSLMSARGMGILLNLTDGKFESSKFKVKNAKLWNPDFVGKTTWRILSCV